MPSGQDEAAVMAAITAAIPLYLEQVAKAADSATRWRVAGRLTMLRERVIQRERNSIRKWRAAPTRRIALGRTLR